MKELNSREMKLNHSQELRFKKNNDWLRFGRDRQLAKCICFTYISDPEIWTVLDGVWTRGCPCDICTGQSTFQSAFCLTLLSLPTIVTAEVKTLQSRT